MDPADEILSQIPISQLAQQLGVDEATAEEAVRSAVPALLGGMAANAQDPGGAASLENALSQHTSNPLDGLGLEGVDTKDGEAIVGNVFGDNTDQVINKLGGKGMMQQLLPILAPIILSMLAGKFMKGQGGGPAPAPAGSEAPAGGPMPSGGTGAGGLEDLLGSATAAAGGSGGGAGGIGDLLGGLLGGSSGGSAAGIEDLLGGLLGGGTKS
jgi:hypothetical protein